MLILLLTWESRKVDEDSRQRRKFKFSATLASIGNYRDKEEFLHILEGGRGFWLARIYTHAKKKICLKLTNTH